MPFAELARVIDTKIEPACRIVLEIRPTTHHLWYDLDVFEANTLVSVARASELTINEAVTKVTEIIKG